MKSSYAESLRNPNWQKKRLQILDRDEWTCQHCFDSTSTLHVHHKYYTKGRKPWEYCDDALVTLCESCHDGETSELRDSHAKLIEAMSSWGFFASHFTQLAEAINQTRPWGAGDPSCSILEFVLRNADCNRMVCEMYFDSIAAKKGGEL